MHIVSSKRSSTHRIGRYFFRLLLVAVALGSIAIFVIHGQSDATEDIAEYYDAMKIFHSLPTSTPSLAMQYSLIRNTTFGPITTGTSPVRPLSDEAVRSSREYFSFGLPNVSDPLPPARWCPTPRTFNVTAVIGGVAGQALGAYAAYFMEPIVAVILGHDVASFDDSKDRDGLYPHTAFDPPPEPVWTAPTPPARSPHRTAQPTPPRTQYATDGAVCGPLGAAFYAVPPALLHWEVALARGPEMAPTITASDDALVDAMRHASGGNPLDRFNSGSDGVCVVYVGIEVAADGTVLARGVPAMAAVCEALNDITGQCMQGESQEMVEGCGAQFRVDVATYTQPTTTYARALRGACRSVVNDVKKGGVKGIARALRARGCIPSPWAHEAFGKARGASEHHVPVMEGGPAAEANVRSVRSLVRQSLAVHARLLSRRQSQLMHVSLGRFVEGLDGVAYDRARVVVDAMSDELIGWASFSSLKLVREERWYMTEHTTIARFPWPTTV